METAPSAAGRSLWPRPLLLGVGVALLPACWVYADLYTRVTLPGASQLGLALFTALAGVARFVEAHRPPTGLLALAGLVLVGSLLRFGPGRRILDAVAPAVLASPFVALAIAVLMERSLGAGVLVAALTAGLLGVLAPEPGRRPVRFFGVGLAVAGLAGLAATFRYVYLLLQAEPSHRLLSQVGERFRDDGGDLSAVLVVVHAAVMVVLAAALWARSPRARHQVPALAASWLGGVVVFGLARAVFDDSAPLPGSLATLVDAVLAAALLVPEARVRREPLPRCRAVGVAGILPALFAGLLLSQAYAGRVFTCPPPDSATVQRIATTSPVFRVALTEDGSTALLAARRAAHLLRMDLHPAPGEPRPIDTGDIRGPPEWPTRPFQLLGHPEELVWVPGTREFIGTMVTPFHYRHPDLEPAGACADPLEFGTLLFRVGEDAERVEQVFTLPGSCWIGAVAWEPESSRLLLGWEWEAGIHALDPETMDVRRVAWKTASGMGDVAAMEVATIAGQTRLFTVSLWGGSGLTELQPRSLEPLRSLGLGGVNYDLAVDPGRGRIYVSSYYASRVQVVDAETFAVVDTIPTGLGTRALRVDTERDLLVISSVYDGELRVWDLAADELLGRHRVGGHIKDIAIDQGRGLAYAWSQCGLLRVDLEAARRGR